MAVTFKPQGFALTSHSTPETKSDPRISVDRLLCVSSLFDTATILDFRARFLDIIEGPVERGPRWALHVV